MDTIAAQTRSSEGRGRVIVLVLGLAASTMACGEGGCEEVDGPMLSDPAEPLIIGGTWGDVLDVMVGERSGMLQWEATGGYVTGLPSSGATEVTVVVREPTQAWAVVFEPDGTRRNERLACPGWVVADLQLELRTDDGVLDAAVEARARAHSPDAVTIHAEVSGDELGPDAIVPHDEQDRLHVSLTYDGTGEPALGSLTIVSQSTDADGNTGNVVVDLATWTLP